MFWSLELALRASQVWSDGVCLRDAWTWRPFLDAFHALMGMDFLYRVYVRWSARAALAVPSQEIRCCDSSFQFGWAKFVVTVCLNVF